MKAVFDRLQAYNDVIDNPHGGAGPRQEDIFREGNAYLEREFPRVDFLLGCALR